MRNILTAIALATVMASPVYAKTVKYDNVVMSSHAPATTRNAATRAFDGAEYVGQDPDSRIQSELRRDPADDR
jgi:hypothetical protein